MKIKPEDVFKQLEGYLWYAAYAADKEKVLKILDEALTEAWEEGYDSGEQNDRFEP
jgi:hypothetical protein